MVVVMVGAAIAPLAEYLGRMHSAIVIEYGRGRSLERLQDTLLLDAYRCSKILVAVDRDYGRDLNQRSRGGVSNSRAQTSVDRVPCS